MSSAVRGAVRVMRSKNAPAYLPSAPSACGGLSGSPDVDDDDVVFTESDVEALRLMNVMVGSGVLDPGLEAAAVRAAGQALSRLAEWELGLLNDYVRARVAVGEVPVDQATVLRFVETMVPMMEQLHSYIWRRHIAALTGRAMVSNAEELTSNTLVVGFVRRRLHPSGPPAHRSRTGPAHRSVRRHRP